MITGDDIRLAIALARPRVEEAQEMFDRARWQPFVAPVVYEEREPTLLGLPQFEVYS